MPIGRIGISLYFLYVPLHLVYAPSYANVGYSVMIGQIMDVTPLVQLRRIHPEKDSDIPLPQYMTPQSAGMDLCAAIEQDIRIKHGDIVLVPTGFAMAIPEGFEGQIRPRSGIAVKHGIGIINTPGTIDSDYRGEVKVAIINMGKGDYILRRGDRIAQMVIKKVYQARLEVVESLDETKRNTGGFGHTGK